ncbi:MAG: hypothetical protein ACRDPI_07610 [Nocardioidaceae bacterium]
MGTGTVVATANVLYSLPADRAREALRAVLDRRPDLVGLQEWYLSRSRLLRESGSVRPVPAVGIRLRYTGPGTGDYVWSAPVVGDCVVGARADRYDLLSCRSRPMTGIGRAELPDRWLGLEPPRLVTVATYRDRRSTRVVTLLNYHLVPGVQSGGRYRDDRPRLAERHRSEVRMLQRLVDAELALGRLVYALGDSNFDGLRLVGLTSAWEGREADPGTLGPDRKIDDVFGPARPASVRLLTNPSDHKAVVVSWPEDPGLSD